MSSGFGQRAIAGIPGPGEVIAGRFRVEREIGVGGMGAVVAAARLDRPGERVAIKLMLPSLAEQSDFLARFVREAKVVTRLSSEHVARVVEIGSSDGGAPFMVMELLEGVNFDALLKRAAAPLPIAQVVGWMLEACDAIADAHAHGVVHRDLKPSNLFLARRAGGADVVKVLDFGISKALTLDAGATDVSTLTNTGAQLGSP
ncbi:MAG TPA: serine/threonine-protein kinase, partial [Minicystis sp.]|nr:serine/threonine-protein kinase [Minicystis sp.]